MSFFRQSFPCRTCGCLLDGELNGVRVFNCLGTYSIFYCNTHKKPYNEVRFRVIEDKPTQYYGRIEMTEDGKPIKPKNDPVDNPSKQPY